MLYNCHTMLAAATSIPEIQLDKTEANQLADAINRVSRHYDLGASEKAMDWSNLFMALGFIYGPRLVAVRNRRKVVAPPQPAQPPQSGETRNTQGDVKQEAPKNPGRVEIPGVGTMPEINDEFLRGAVPNA